ncbi:Mov34/MPN/PAD-1 family protein [Natronomonas sp. F2-12]|jgi:proteasome lid subunit RPN8/RPN11|uniref:Mov34/MPN/PAD-1 family protein n=1 Tax=Natronomonas aquatica TaxID=2841590 RepID=A0A9R1CV27_9EURY|nr:Mov34/MPN/PAD-1 family protein [Natronomonas aquatica]MCQ4334287.1 Mov34/MPN/PAD-1 family protein [Natronomonas aquatica]
MGLFGSFLKPKLFRSSAVIGIAADALQLALEASEDAHPNEYMGQLRGQDARTLGLDRDGTVVTDVLLAPGTKTTPTSAEFKPTYMPNDLKSVGSVHSHPNGVLTPSQADLATFTRGPVHIIVGAPYGRNDWRAFDRDGEPIDLEVLDVEIPDEQFFDFTQADIDRELR